MNMEQEKQIHTNYVSETPIKFPTTCSVLKHYTEGNLKGEN
jgi:hypothetical protein